MDHGSIFFAHIVFQDRGCGLDLVSSFPDLPGVAHFPTLFRFSLPNDSDAQSVPNGGTQWILLVLVLREEVLSFSMDRRSRGSFWRSFLHMVDDGTLLSSYPATPSVRCRSTDLVQRLFLPQTH